MRFYTKLTLLALASLAVFSHVSAQADELEHQQTQDESEQMDMNDMLAYADFDVLGLPYGGFGYGGM